MVGVFTLLYGKSLKSNFIVDGAIQGKLAC